MTSGIRYAARALLAASVLLFASSCAGEPPLTYVSLGDSLAVGVGASDPRERGYAPSTATSSKRRRAAR